MPEYRRPEEEQIKHEHDAYVQKILDQALRDGTSLMVAMRLGEPAQVVEHWINTLWDGLRDNLTDDRPDRGGLKQEDRLKAIVLLLQPQVAEAAQAILQGMAEAGDA